MYNIGFRKAAVALYHYFGNMKKTSQALQIGVATVWRWVKKGITITPRKQTPVPEALKEFVKLCVIQENHITQRILRYKVKTSLGLQVSRRCISAILKSLGLTRKRLRNRGKLPSDIPMSLFTAFKHQILSSVSTVAVDEVGFDQRTTPLFGYSPKGSKAIAVTHPTSRKRFTAIAAIDRTGKRRVHIHEDSVNGDTFATFVRSLDWPPGTTIILDNARIHKTYAVQEALMQKGYRTAFTPPYSPDCNPIENMFSWIKNRFRYRVLELCNPFQHIIHHCFTELPASVCLNCFERTETKVLKNIIL
jgi:transposase